MAELCSVGDTVDAAPDDFLSAVNIPSHALIRTAAFPTVQPFGKGVLAVVPPALLFASVRAGLAVAAGDFSLCLSECLLRDDSLVVILYVILRQLAGIFLGYACQYIRLSRCNAHTYICFRANASRMLWRTCWISMG